jgi:hypothetical protein
MGICMDWLLVCLYDCRLGFILYLCFIDSKEYRPVLYCVLSEGFQKQDKELECRLIYVEGVEGLTMYPPIGYLDLDTLIIS